MALGLRLPLLDAVLPSGLKFGANYLVEFESHSIWYETSLSLCAQALRQGLKADYHTFSHIPGEVRVNLERLGVDVQGLEADDRFRVWDSFTVQTGTGEPEKIGRLDPRDPVDIHTLNLDEWTKADIESASETVPETDTRRLHMDDDTSILLQYNDEKKFISHWRTQTIPFARAREIAVFHAILKGVYSDAFYSQFESLCDGIIEFKAEESAGRLAHWMRVRAMRGSPHDSSWQPLRLLDTGEVILARPGRDVAVPRLGADDEAETLKLVGSTSEVSLDKYRVVGRYMRYDDKVRNDLKDARQRIVASVKERNGQENFLLWGAPGSGKSYFVQQLASQVGHGCDYRELNLAQADEDCFRDQLKGLGSGGKNLLCFVDELDSKQNEVWPFELLLPVLESGKRESRRCFVLAGSAGTSIQDLSRLVSQRPKGPDLLSRIPNENGITIPPLTGGDRMIIALTHLLSAARERSKAVTEVEKLALYYVVLNPELRSPRQLRQFVQAAAEKIPPGEDRIKYDYLFRAGDPRNKEFWIRSKEAHGELVDKFVSVVDVEREGR